MQISEDEILDYYENNPEKFESPKTVEARHILINVDQDASDEIAAEAKKRIEET